MQRKNQIKAFAYSIVLLSASIIFGYIEAIFPISIGQVGIKIGLSNIITIIAIKTIGIKKSFLINILRLTILGIYFGNLIRLLISVSGFSLSFVAMILTLYVLRFSITISSMIGGVFHNLGQFAVLVILLKNSKILYMIPIYVIVGIVSGLIVGIISTITYKKIHRIIIE